MRTSNPIAFLKAPQDCPVTDVFHCFGTLIQSDNRHYLSTDFEIYSPNFPLHNVPLVIFCRVTWHIISQAASD